MTVLEQLVVTARSDPRWSERIANQANTMAESPTCQAWGRKGGSHYKDGQFTKK
ncbi:MAG TPA: multiple cyclophane-containing RiPP AmcA [Actinophytocola sp.]|jgi:hypothetical protein|nr:multiple cyclophane-containing RiPP AmcA [Actinophytocola sp.]